MTKLGKKARARTQSHHLHWDEIPFILETCDIQWFTVKLVKWNICIKCVCAFHCNNQARWQRRWRRQQFGFCFYFCFVALRIIFTHFTSTSSFVVSNNFSSMTLSSMLSCHFHSLRMPVYGLVMRCHSPVFTFAFYSHLMAAATIAHNSNGYFSSRFASFNNWFSSSFFFLPSALFVFNHRMFSCRSRKMCCDEICSYYGKVNVICWRYTSLSFQSHICFGNCAWNVRRMDELLLFGKIKFIQLVKLHTQTKAQSSFECWCQNQFWIRLSMAKLSPKKILVSTEMTTCWYCCFIFDEICHFEQTRK